VVNIKCDILSFRAGGNIAYANDEITTQDLITSIEAALALDATIINISMGILSFAEFDSLQAICRDAAKKNCLIIAASGNESRLTLPFCCADVFKIITGNGIQTKITIEDQYGCSVVTVNRQLFMTASKNTERLYSYGSSASTAYVTALLVNCYNQLAKTEHCIKIERLLVIETFLEKYVTTSAERINADRFFKQIPMFSDKPPFLEEKSFIGTKCVMVPYSKETASLLRFHNLTNISALSIIDPVKKGYVGKDANALAGADENKLIINNRFDDDVLDKSDSMIIGYISELGSLDAYFSMENMLNIALKYHLDVFSFTPVNKLYRQQFLDKGLDIYGPIIIDNAKLNALKNFIPYLIGIQKPVLGVFGTSSKQGKFTLQLKLKQALTKNGVRINMLASEHHASLRTVRGRLPLIGSRASKASKVVLACGATACAWRQAQAKTIPARFRAGRAGGSNIPVSPPDAWQAWMGRAGAARRRSKNGAMLHPRLPAWPKGADGALRGHLRRFFRIVQ
jgi:hypothetical protein